MSDTLVFLTVIFAVLAVLCLTVALRNRDGSLLAGLRSSWGLLLVTLPVYIFALIFAGYIQVLLPNAGGAVKRIAMPPSAFISTTIFIVLLGWSMLYAYTRHDGTFSLGLRETWKMFSENWLLLVAAWIFAGYTVVLLPQEFILRWLGPESGLKGIFLACVAGGITPGGPFISLPICGALYRAGAGEGVVVAYLSAWALYAFGRMPFEIYFLGAPLTFARLASVLIFPPLAGIIAKALFEK